MTSEWYKTPSGDNCPWCTNLDTDYEPFDDDDAAMTLCRGHFAEFSGESLASLDRREADIRADMTNLGYFD